VVASTIAFFSVRAANAPPDSEHPYGHGKIESMAGFSESILLLFIVAYIVFEAIQRLVHRTIPQNLGIGVAAMAFSAASALPIGRYVSKVGQETESMALRSNGQHLLVDFWTCVGVLLALLVTHFTHWVYADPFFAILFALWLARGAAMLGYEAFQQLIDRRLSDEQIVQIHDTLKSEPNVISYHKLRTRCSGNLHYVDVHIVVPNDWTVVQAHNLADGLEKRLTVRLAPAVVTIHVDPYEQEKEYPA
jgi:cation diffusion facilitator family transporter